MTTDKNVRYTIDLSAEARDELAGWAGQYKLTQGEVIEVLLAFVRNSDQVSPALVAKREAKVEARTKRRKMMEVLRKMSPEEIAGLEAMAAAK